MSTLGARLRGREVVRLRGELETLRTGHRAAVGALSQALAERDEWRSKAEGFEQSWDSLADEMTEVEERVATLEGFVQTIVDASDFDFTDATLYEWACELHDQARALLDASHDQERPNPLWVTGTGSSNASHDQDGPDHE